MFEPPKDLDYSEPKEGVVRHAGARGASEEVLRALPLRDCAGRELAPSGETMGRGI